MKTTRRLLALLTVLALVLALGTTAFAATIEVDNATENETYTVYKIFDATANTGNDNKINATDPVSYTIISTNNAVWTTIIGSATADAKGVYTAQGLTFTPTASNPSVYVVAKTDDFNAATFAAFLKTNVTSLGTAVATLNKDNAYTATDLATGYYFVTSSLGSLCALATEDSIQVIEEKNTAPTVDKKQSATEGSYADAALDLNIGDTVYYQVEVKDGNGTDADITLTDTLSAGLTLNTNSIVVKNGNTVLTKDTDYTLTATTAGFTLVLEDTYVATLAKDAVVTVTYNATVNSSAVVDSATGNSNTIEMDYSKQSMTDIVYVSTYDFNVSKTDGNNTALTGAKFKLYDAATGGTEIKLSKDNTGYYVDADGTEVIEAGTSINVRGLKPGTYYLEETEAPAGYNKLSARRAVEINTGATSAVEVTVVNQAGSVLPSTGGMGTTIFYVLGGILAVGALIVLVTNKRMRA